MGVESMNIFLLSRSRWALMFFLAGACQGQAAEASSHVKGKHISRRVSLAKLGDPSAEGKQLVEPYGEEKDSLVSFHQRLMGDAIGKDAHSFFPGAPHAFAEKTEGNTASRAKVPSVLILFDSTGPEAYLADGKAQMTANLVSHFGDWQAMPVKDYTRNLLEKFDATIYIGAIKNEPIPHTFLEDLDSTEKQVVWVNGNIDQLASYMPDFQERMGWIHTKVDKAPIAYIAYRGAQLQRDPKNPQGLMGIEISDEQKVEVLASAKRKDGSTRPWAVRSENFFYISECPDSYMGMNDRYLAWCDMLYTVLAPETPERHRALVRIEDVGPDMDPGSLKAIADVLSSRGIPFSIATYPVYVDPMGKNNHGVPLRHNFAVRPEQLEDLKYAISKGGSLIMHGLTHQYEKLINPYNGISGDDFEFYTTHVDEKDYVVYDGPVPKDSAAWMKDRLATSAYAFKLAGLPVPTIFEAPHYAASSVDYQVVAKHFKWRYDRGLYFPGFWQGKPDYERNHPTGQFFPYLVRDVYGSLVIPENIGNVELEAMNHHPARLPKDLLECARLNKLAIRDGVASFFYHTYIGTDHLVELVDGLNAQGWDFVAAMDLE